MDLVAGPLHEDLAPLAFLLGTWRGEGEGGYPTMEPFRYGEEIAFGHVGDRFLVYEQRSWSAADGTPLHLERGFLRPGRPGRIELTLAHPLGLTEIAEGDLDGTGFTVATGTMGRTSTGSAVWAVRRRYTIAGDELVYELHMEMDRIPMSRHLRAKLRRVTRA
ncbi:MAG: FABP family protein [Actinomycetota bacterium]